MGLQNLSEYLAQQTVKHIQEKVGSSVFGGNVLNIDKNTVTLWKNYKVSFQDEGKKINIVVDNNGGGYKDLYEILQEYSELNSDDPRSLKLSPKEKNIFKSIEISRKNGLSLEIKTKEYNNTSGRTNNREKLFYGVYRKSVRPILRAIGELEKIV